MTKSKPLSPDLVITARTLLHRGKKFDFELLTVRPPNARPYKRENVRHPGAVVVVAMLDGPARRAKAGESASGRAKGRNLVLVSNFRVSLEQRILECCAGTIERPHRDKTGRRANGFGKGESPRTCAARELVEETGFRAAKLIPLGSFYTTPGLTDEHMFAFAATGLTYVGQDLEADESIDVEIVPVARVLAMIRTGEIRDAKSMLAISLARDAGLL